jgi:hypothetical protein
MAKGLETVATKPDDLESVRKITDALQGFKPEEQDRIIRWSRERLGLATAKAPAEARADTMAEPFEPGSQPRSQDIRSFVAEKNPQSDVHLATTLVFYYRFVAPQDERKDEVDSEFIREACRKAGQPGKLKNPQVTLNNAERLGLLDRVDRGKFAINSVGENLVGMILPGNGGAVPPRRRPRAANRQKQDAHKNPRRKTR